MSSRLIIAFVLYISFAFGQSDVALVERQSKDISDRQLIATIEEQKAEGVFLFKAGAYQAAALTFQEAGQRLERNAIIDYDLLASCYQKAALSYSYLEWYDLAEEFSFKSIKYARQAENPEPLALDYATLGEIYDKQGQFEKALSYFDSCLQIDQQLNDSLYIAADYSAIGLINTKIGREQEGIDLLKKAVEVTTNSNNLREHCLRVNALGLGYIHTHSYAAAKLHLLESLRISKEIKDTNLIINRLINLGDLHVKMKDLGTATDYFQQSLMMMATDFSPKRYTIIYRNLGEIYQQKGAYTKAISYYQKSLKIAEDKKLLPEVRKIYKSLQAVYKAKRDYRTALAYSEKFKQVSDSIFTLQTRTRATIFNNKFSLTEKEKAIQQLDFTNELQKRDMQNLKMQRYWLLLSLLLTFLLGGVSFYAFRQRKQNQLQLKEAKINRQLQEIMVLRTEIAHSLAEKQQSILTSTLTFSEINQFIPTPLTEREYEVLQLVIQGKNNKEIAAEIFLSVNTIKFHLKNLYAKLEVKNRLQAIQLALKK